MAIYSYFAETEQEFISIRTKQGLAAVKASGRKLGHPQGGRNKERAIDRYKQEIKKYLERGVDLAATTKIINPELQKLLIEKTNKTCTFDA